MSDPWKQCTSIQSSLANGYEIDRVNSRLLPMWGINKACDHIRAKYKRISSILISALDITTIHAELHRIIISYLLLDPRIIDMLIGPPISNDHEPLLRRQFRDSNETRLITFYKSDEIFLIGLDEGYHRPGYYYCNRKEHGDALIALFGRAKLLLSRNPNHLLARLLDSILREFEIWRQSQGISEMHPLY